MLRWPHSANGGDHLGPANDIVMAKLLTTGPVVQPMVIARIEPSDGQPSGIRFPSTQFTAWGSTQQSTAHERDRND